MSLSLTSKKIVNFLIASTALTVSILCHAEITRKVDSFDGNVTLSSSLYEGSYTELKFNTSGYSEYSMYTGPFFAVNFYKYKTNSGMFNWLLLYLKSTTYSYIGYDSIGQVKIDNTIINLDNSPFESIKYISLRMEPLLPYLLDGKPHTFSIRVSGRQGTFDLPISEPILGEWRRLAAMSIDDISLVGAMPFGSSLYMAGKNATGWAVDPKSSAYKPVLHVYRGGKFLLETTANIEDCGANTGKACASFAGVKDSWRKYAYQFDLERVAGASTEPLKIYAINSNSAHPNPEIVSQNLMLRDDIECVFNWAEKSLPKEIIPEKKITQDEGIYRVRRYSNQTMLAAIYGGGQFSFKVATGPLTDGGNLSQFLPDAISQNCGK